MFVRMVIVAVAVAGVAVAVPKFAPDLFPARSAVAPHQEASVSAPTVIPGFAFTRSRILRLLGSASALKTLSAVLM